VDTGHFNIYDPDYGDKYLFNNAYSCSRCLSNSCGNNKLLLEIYAPTSFLTQPFHIAHLNPCNWIKKIEMDKSI